MATGKFSIDHLYFPSREVGQGLIKCGLNKAAKTIVVQMRDKLNSRCIGNRPIPHPFTSYLQILCEDVKRLLFVCFRKVKMPYLVINNRLSVVDVVVVFN